MNESAKSAKENNHMTISDLMSEADYAAMRGVTLRTIQRDRKLGIGPAFVKLGQKVYYRPAAIEAYILANERNQS
jgi:hypothetical protein